MAPVVIDTTVLIDVLKGRPGTLARYEALHPAGDDPYVCAVSVEEVAAGLRPSERHRAGLLLEGLREAPLGIAEGRLAGRWRRGYRQRGRTLSQADCLIAASAVRLGARLATGNPKDFPMKDVIVEHWPVGL
jgi:predicted nucleic acid-binding protein